MRLLADDLSEDGSVGRAVLHWARDPIADALPLRLAGSLHALVLSGRSAVLSATYPPRSTPDDHAFRRVLQDVLDTHADAILRFVDGPPQTNEVARSAALAAGFHVVAALTSLPLATLEIGASAGLNLHWDSFGFDLGGVAIKKDAGRPLLAPAWEGPSPPIGNVRIAGRAGCDRAPIDIRSPDQVLRLRAYLWPDQTERLERLDRALAVAKANPVPIACADAADWAEARLSRRRQGVATVLYHSIVWQYLPQESQRRLQHTIDRSGRQAGDDAPFAWLRMEPESQEAAALRLTLWPKGETLLLADVDYHGRWIRWHVGADDLT